jgi:hypothetical protein
MTFSKPDSKWLVCSSLDKTIKVFDIYINITLRRLQYLYTVVDYSGVSGGTGYRVRPTKINHNIGNFLYPITASSPKINSLDVNPRIEINNMFLDNEERKRFALSTHDYLITQLQVINNTYNYSKSIPFDLTNINKKFA